MRHTKQATVKQDRRGSMLIMVIVILVLLALIGTAMISTSRVDRVATVQHSVNTQVDLLFESVKRLAVDAVRADLFGNSGGTQYYKPASGLGTQYRHYDYPLEDRYLASRSPEILNLFAASSAAGGANAPFWPSITFPLLGDQFENPLGTSFPLTLNKNQYRFAPTTGTFNGKPWPHLAVFEMVGGPPPVYNLLATIPAADTDGDGIADAGMFRLPVGELNGVTYFAAVRIIDQGSTINLSTAWKNNNDFIAGVGVMPGDMFPSNVDTERFLASKNLNETNNLNTYRFNPTAGTYNLTPVDDAGNNRTDFIYVSPYDALHHQLTVRLSNPGRNTSGAGGVKYQALPETDDMSLAYPFAWYNQSLGTSTAATYLPDSLGAQPAGNVRTTEYGSTAADVKTWFDNNFEFRTGFVLQADRMLRATVSVRNPVSNTARPHAITALPVAYRDSAQTQPSKIPDYQYASGAVPKVCINTAPFGELWRGFWNVMAETPINAPYADDQRMFRNVLRDPATQPTGTHPMVMTSFEMMMLRSAIAAMNAIDLRDNDFNVTSQKIQIADTAGLVKYEAMVFGGEPQPFITEVYVNTSTEGGANPKGYIGVEVFNPYPVDISLENWQLAIVNRAPDGPAATADRFPSQRLQQITGFAGFPAGAVVPANGHVLIENMGGTNAATNATTRPGVTTQPTTRVSVDNLHEVLVDGASTQPSGGELILLKPRNASLVAGKITSVLSSGTDYDETVALPLRLAEMVPVDQFDFSNTTFRDVGPFEAINYVRQSGTDNLFKQVYPGKYTIGNMDRHEGTIRWVPTTGPSTQPQTTQPTMGQADSASSYLNDLAAVQWHNVDWGGPNPYNAGPNRFPFGGFARNVDMLEVPFIGAYRIRTTAIASTTEPLITEMNGVALDSSFAEDMDTATDHHEMLGRFCPVFAAYDINNSGNTTQPTTMPTTQQAGKPPTDWYAWTADFFDYFAVNVPNGDYFPHVEPNLYPPGNVQAVKNGSQNAADSRLPQPAGTSRWSEELIGNEGLININTAPWYILARLPWVPPFQDRLALDLNPASANYGELTYVAGGNGVPDNMEIGVLIAAWRDGGYLGYGPGNGPFKTIFDLNSVQAPLASQKNLTFQNGFGLYSPGGPMETEWQDDTGGDVTPFGATTDGIRWDFEERFQMINRVSNLITTRSDAFTIYLTLQGWRNLTGTGPAELVVERKAAMLVNRTGVVKITDSPKVTNIPTN